MRQWRLLGVRAHLLAAMMLLALASVAISAAIINRAVDSELRDFSKRDLRFSATNAAELAASAYLEAGGWSARPVNALRAIARGRGDAVVVLGADRRPVVGSPASALDWADGERAPVVVRGVRVGTVVATHPRDGGVASAAKRLDRHLQGRMDGLLLEAGIVAGALALLLALLIAVQVVRPLRRLTEAAERMGAGEIETRATGSGGGREMTRLAQTMDRLAAALRRQDELRRATAADVSHELRGALSGVFGRVEALRLGFVEDEQAALLQIESDAHRVRRLVDDVDRFAEAQRHGLLVRKRPTDLDTIVHACVAGYADRCRALSIALTRRVSPARVVGDPERLAQVLDNLLSNALRYTDPGGRVAVTLEARGAEAVIEVSDSGIGIAPEHVERIFDRFWRSPEARARAGEGSGIGLALLSELVRAHNGRVAVASEPGRGTTFSVFLPLGEPPAAPARRTPPAAVPDLWRRRGELAAAGARPDAPLAG
jgi:two-component system, OmpR family, sensor histidine kinase BaeS